MTDQKTVTGVLRAPGGEVVPGGSITFKLNAMTNDIESGDIILPFDTVAVADENGAFSVDLWPNDRGVGNTYYTVKGSGQLDGTRLSFEFTEQVQVKTTDDGDFGKLVARSVYVAKGLSEQLTETAIQVAEDRLAAAQSAAQIDPDGLEVRFSQQVADGVAAMDVALGAHIAQARSEYPAVNLWKNAQATAVDSGGNLLTPLTVATSYSGSETTITQRVLVPNHPDLPPEINAALLPSGNLVSKPVNCIELTLNQNDGNGKFRLMAFRMLKGRYTAGAAYVQAASDGIRLADTDLVAGTLYENLKSSSDSFFHVNGLFGTVIGNGKKLYVALPYVAAGVLSQPPLFLLDSNYHNAF